jgi:hypothetical protein
MRSLILGTLTLAFIASVSAKVDIGSCRTDIKKVDWATYSKTTVPAPYSHKIGAIDSGFKDLIEVLQNFGFKLPFNPYCDDLGKIHPFSVFAVAQKAEADKAKAT